MELKQSLRKGFYSVCRVFSSAAMTAFTAVRHINVPDGEQLSGSMLACNHQSYLDPVLVGMALGRPLNYLARSQLFEPPVFGELISALGAHPVRQGGSDSAALRTVIGLLRRQEPVLLFPEGTRSVNGEIGRFQPGIASLAIRCNARVIPVCIEGAFRSWPRNRMMPVPACVAVMYGEPIVPSEYKREQLTHLIHCRIAGMQSQLRTMLGR